jgi:hypothetical protein
MIDAGDGEEVASVSAKSCFYAASAYATHALGGRSRVQRELAERLNVLAADVEAPALTASSSSWVRSTGSPIGVWTHWLDGVLHNHGIAPGPTWMVTAPKHDPKNPLDWQSLRKGPRLLPKNQVEFLAREGVMNLNNLDAGWLLNQHNSSHPINPDGFERAPTVVRLLRSHLAEVAAAKNRISASAGSTRTITIPEPASGPRLRSCGNSLNGSESLKALTSRLLVNSIRPTYCCRGPGFPMPRRGPLSTPGGLGSLGNTSREVVTLASRWFAIRSKIFDDSPHKSLVRATGRLFGRHDCEDVDCCFSD